MEPFFAWLAFLGRKPCNKRKGGREGDGGEREREVANNNYSYKKQKKQKQKWRKLKKTVVL
jgi:hypothetical protein